MQSRFASKWRLVACWLAVFIIVTWASTAMASATYTVSDKNLTIAVPAKEDANLDSTEFQAALDAGVTNIVMNGPGRIIANIDTTAYAGSIRILGGTWQVVDSKGLGKVGTAPSGDNMYVESIDGAGNIYVNGGTLEAKVDASATSKVSINYRGKVVYFAGNGQDGAGALVANLASGKVVDKISVFSSNLIMTGDATIANIGTAQCQFFALGINLCMNGHSLTMKGSESGAGFTWREVRITEGNPGSIIQQGGLFEIIGYNQLHATKSVAYTANGDAHIDLTTESFGGRFNPKVVWNSTGTNDWRLTRYPTKFIWTNGLELQRDMTVLGTCYFGAISGTGGLSLIGGSWPNGATNTLTGASTYTGPLMASNTVLNLSAKALSSSQASFSANDTTVNFSSSDAATYPQAVMTVSDGRTVSVNGGSGSWTTSLEKRGSGTLNYNSYIGGETLKLKAGAINFRSQTAKLNSNTFGLIEGLGYYPDHTSAQSAQTKQYVFRDTIVPSLTKDNCLAYYGTTDKKKTMSWFPAKTGGWYDASTNTTGTKAYYLLTYTGYIWNHADTNVTWSFGGNFCGRNVLFIDGTKIFDGNNTSQTQHGNHTLTPGAHEFYFGIACVTYDGGAGGADKTWGGVGIRYDPNGRNTGTGSDYINIANVANELPLITWVKDKEAVELPRGGKFFNYGKTSASYDEIALSGDYVGTLYSWAGFNKVEAAVGTTIDFNGAVVKFTSLAGAPTLACATAYSPFTLTDTWTIDASTLPRAGLATAPMHVASLAFGDDTEMVIDNPTVFHTPGNSWLLATSDADITGKLSIKSSDTSITDRWQLDVGTRTVTLRRLPRGMIMIVN